MLLSVVTGLSFTAKAKDYQGIKTKAYNLQTGDTFQLGNYPQSRVTDKSLLSVLNNKSVSMTSYGYMSNLNASSHTYDEVGMSWGDITYNNSMYRKVIINQYRPLTTSVSSTFSSSDQDDNGYTTGSVYYFKWEPIVWRVLSSNSNGVQVISKISLDAQSYNDSGVSTIWQNASIRYWLNSSFYYSAFSLNEKKKITPSKNNGVSDNVWLLSFEDAENSFYGFTDNNSRRAFSSDYAKSQGISVSKSDDTKGLSIWLLRDSSSNEAGAVYNYGEVVIDNFINYCDRGVRPVIMLNPKAEVYKSDAPQGGGEITTPSEPQLFSSGTKEYKGKYGFYYKDSYFDNSSTAYNQSLATMSLCLAFSTYQTNDGSITYQNAKDVLEKCEFENIKTYGYNKKTEKDGLGAIISSKLINGERLICVAVRSGGYGAEWSSNLKVDAYGDHFGFEQSAEKLQGYISSYIQKYKLEGNIKLWITGYSRGAAVATQTAAMLNNSGGVSYVVDGAYKTVTFSKESIYAYGFATPAGAIDESKPHSEKYNNIFNVIDYNDPVPLVAPSKWKFDRYGTTKILPYRESADSKKFSKYYNRITKRMGDKYKVDVFKNYTIGGNKSLANAVYQKFNKDTLGTFNKKLINGLAGVLGSRENYYKKYQYDLMSFLEKKMGSDDLDIGLVLQEACDLAPKMAVLHPNLTVTLAKNIKLIADVHANQDYYIAWMQLMDSNYSDSLPQMWGNYNYRTVKANCPVDVYVYDSEDNLVASIINEVPQEIENSTIISSIDENDQKVVYLPVDEEYRVEVKPRETCEVSYSIDEFNAENGEQVRATNYSNINLSEDEVLSGTIDGFADEEIENGAAQGSETDYSLLKNENEVQPESDIKGTEEIKNHTYSVTATYDENQGEILGVGNYVEGSFAKLTAVNKPGYDFEGFYINGVKLVDDDLDENRYTVRTQMLKDVEVEARFNICTHKTVKDKAIAATLTKDGKTEGSHCSICNMIIKEQKTVAAIKTVKLSDTSYTYNGKKKTPSVKVTDSKGKALSKNTDYKVTYPSERIDVGTYSVKVTFKGKYSGTKNLTFKINPKGTSISKLTSGKKKFTVKWKKQKNQTTGYQIQYAANSKFSKNKKTITVTKNSTTSKTIKKLKANKKYYVRIRTYKKVGSMKYYSTWSKSKTVTTKK